jgi:hypothetical protein
MGQFDHLKNQFGHDIKQTDEVPFNELENWKEIHREANAKNNPNPKQKYGDAKVKLQLVPPAAMMAIARGLEEGAVKYGPWNWRDQPVELMTYYGSTFRHLVAWLEAEDLDPDSELGKSHLDGAIASLAILIDAYKAGTYIDNRPAVSSAGALEDLQRGSRIEK